jgi:NADH:ubiquinone oxidoreductase subunit C
MDSPALVALLQEAVPEARFESAPSIDLQTTLYVARDDVPLIAQALRDRPNLHFALLAELTAADFWPREPRFELVYMLVSIEHGLRLRLKVRLQGDDARVATVSTIWPAANWLER